MRPCVLHSLFQCLNSSTRAEQEAIPVSWGDVQNTLQTYSLLFQQQCKVCKLAWKVPPIYFLSKYAVYKRACYINNAVWEISISISHFYCVNCKPFLIVCSWTYQTVKIKTFKQICQITMFYFQDERHMRLKFNMMTLLWNNGCWLHTI